MPTQQKPRWLGWVSALFTLVLSPILLGIAFMSIGEGGASYLLCKLFYPYAMTLTWWTGKITMPLFVLAMIQVPAYGIYLQRRIGRGRWKARLLELVVMHAAWVLAAFTFSAPTLGN